MHKQITATALAIFLSTNSYAANLKTLMKKAANCVSVYCPYGNEFTDQPQVKQAIKKSFKNANVAVPYWVFKPELAFPVEYSSENGAQKVKIVTCEPHGICDDNGLEGWYDYKTNTFSGTFVKKGKIYQLR